jgi:membrane-associated phospholipid phosphatase
MTPADYVIHVTLSVVLIIGGYQFYFWCQRNQLAVPRQLRSPVDDLIPYRPRWVWIYSFLYYPVILYTNLIVGSPQQFTHLAISYLLLLAFQMAFFLAFPVVTPESWRECNQQRSHSERFLAFVQRLDARSNSFPSMHTSVAMLTALHLYPSLGAGVLSFPILIGLSCLFTKQHYVVDVPAGAALGWAAFHAIGIGQ